MAEPKTAAEKIVASASRSVSIHLSNFSANILTNPQVYTESGYCCGTPQPTVESGVVATCSFAKRKIGTCGAVGVLTYDIAEDRKEKAVERLAIMFSVPFDYNFYKNWFALGLFETIQACDAALFELMYNNDGMGHKRGKGLGSELRHEDGRYTLIGTMSSGGNAEIKVELRNNEIKSI